MRRQFILLLEQQLLFVAKANEKFELYILYFPDKMKNIDIRSRSKKQQLKKKNKEKLW